MPTDIPLDDYYKLLGLRPGANLKSVRDAYKKLTVRCNPERFPSGSLEAHQAQQIRQKLDDAYQRLTGVPEKNREDLYNSPVTLTGTRAQIVPMETGHTEELFAAAHFPEIWTWLPAPMPNSLEDMARMVGAALENRAKGEEMPFVVRDQDSGSIVGSTRFLDISTANRNLEIGWTWYTPSVWRTRINTECKYLLLRHAFETLGAVRVQLKTDGRNLRSQAAIARIGGIREGVLRRQRILHDGYIRDTVYFSILDTEWPDVKARLEQMLEAGG